MDLCTVGPLFRDLHGWHGNHRPVSESHKISHKISKKVLKVNDEIEVRN